VDKVIKDFCGRTINFVELPSFTFGKELQLHVMELKANKPFKSPELFEETMQNAVVTLLHILEKKYNAHLLGTGMHPLLKLDETGIWPHRHRKIYQELGKLFNLKTARMAQHPELPSKPPILKGKQRRFTAQFACRLVCLSARYHCLFTRHRRNNKPKCG